MDRKPRLGFWQIWNMCFGFLGVQVGFALQNSNVSRIFQTLGADVDDLAILWIAAPLTGLLVQPIIGYMSDRTWTRLGRRRPYFFYGALLTTAALIVMPNSPYLWLAAGMLWIMDASINITMEPFRAFVGDLLPQEQRATGFAMQSFFIGVGSVFASALPYMFTNWLGVANTAPEGIVPDSVTYSFYVGGGFVLIAVMWTVFRTREYPPEDMERYEKAETENLEPSHQPQAEESVYTIPSARKFFVRGGLWFVSGGFLTIVISQLALEKELYVLSFGGTIFGIMLIIAGLMRQRGVKDNPFSEIIDDLFLMPKTMRQLAVVQFFSWFAFFALWLYTTPAVTAFHYGATDTTSTLYNEGANWVGVLFGVYNGVAAIAAFAIMGLARRISRKMTHILCLLMGGGGLASMALITDPNLLWISMTGVGFAWASILSLPYAILSGAVPSSKMGIYMGIFNFFIVIPQIVAATILGAILREVFDGTAVYVLVTGGASLAIAAIATLRVDDHTDPVTNKQTRGGTAFAAE